MVTGDCDRCPVGPRECSGCILSVLGTATVLAGGLSEDSCGFVLAPEVRSAIEVLFEVGLVSIVEIMGVEAAA